MTPTIPTGQYLANEFLKALNSRVQHEVSTNPNLSVLHAPLFKTHIVTMLVYRLLEEEILLEEDVADILHWREKIGERPCTKCGGSGRGGGPKDLCKTCKGDGVVS